MQFKRTKLRDAISFALVVGTTGFAGSALAQEAQPEQKTEQATDIDAIVVTGSRISIPGLTTNSPVMTVERSEIDRAQPATAEDFLKQVPAAVPAIGPGTNNGSNGGATINLRGLGSNRTVVLMDGRRVVPFNLNGVVDTNVIPVALIQSVDLVTGGASAVYGADAVAGVVNFVLRRDFEGIEISSSYGQSSRGDADRFRTDVTVGANFDDGRGNVVLSLGKTDNDPLLQGDRDFSRFNFDSSDGSAGGSGTTTPTRVGGIGQFNPTTQTLTNPIVRFNFNPYNFNQTALDRWQANALGRYEITDKAEAYAQMLYTRSNVFSQIAPGGLFGTTFDIGIGNPSMPDGVRNQLCTFHNARVAANPAAGTAITNCAPGSAETARVALFRRTTEYGPRFTDFQNKVFQATVGLRGDLTDHWRYDTYWSHGEADQLVNQGGFLSFSRTQQALLSTDGVNCVDPSGGCRPLNLWVGNGQLDPSLGSFLSVTTFAKQRVTQDLFSASVSGDLGDNVKSPWADYPIGLAFGVESRKVSALNIADAASRDPLEVMGSGGANPDISGHLKLNEAYTEMLLPIVSGHTGAYALNLEAGYRRSQFDAGQGSTSYGSYKYGLEWAPIESLRFRAMFQRATRAPNVNELFFPQTTALDNRAVDPCQLALINTTDFNTPGTLSNLCRQTGVPNGTAGTVPEPSAAQLNVFTGGNPGLSPEKADTTTIGLVWQPVTDLAITLDYWKIDIKDTISSFTIDDILDGCYSPTLNPGYTMNSFCQLVVGGRDPLDGSFNGNARGPIQILDNLGATQTDGWDLGVRYGFDVGSMGRIDLALDLTKTQSYDNQPTALSPVRDCVGFYSVSCNNIAGIIYDYKWNQRTTWTINDFSVGLNWRHLSAIDVEPTATSATDWYKPYQSVDSYDYFDLSFQYNLPWNARINFTVNNVADKDPPIVGSTIGSTSVNSGNTFPQFYDTIGRYYTLGLTMKF
ncbi:TonB-dependent receptor domain-containing protein [Lysobacter fragariae]